MTERELTSDLLSETHTSCAVNASSHRSLDEGTEVLVLDGTLVFSEATFLVAIDGRDVLQVALTTLIANGAVKRMVSEQELHDTTSGNSRLLRLGDDLEVRTNLGSARSDRLGHTLALNETHTAVTSNRESLVIAETRDLNTGLSARLIDSVGAINLFNKWCISCRCLWKYHSKLTWTALPSMYTLNSWLMG